jgi:hypothetical protein
MGRLFPNPGIGKRTSPPGKDGQEGDYKPCTTPPLQLASRVALRPQGLGAYDGQAPFPFC